MVSFPSVKDIADVHKKYPQLHYESTNLSWRLVGSIDIVDNVGNYYDSYDIEIIGTLQFPYGFPKLFERSNKFEKTADWHTFQEESCCTAVPAKEILTTLKGITLKRYIDDFAVPYLANQTHRRQHGHYVNGEYEHGLLGELTFFKELFETENLNIVILGIKSALSNNDFNNLFCFCNSNNRYKHCHKKAVQKARLLGKDYLFDIYNRIYKILSAENVHKLLKTD